MATDPKQVKAQAVALLSEKNYAEALKLYHALLKDFPDDAAAWTAVGDICRKLKKIDHAVSSYVKASRQFALTGHLIQAISVNKLILELDPDHTETQEQLANLYSRAKEKANPPEFDEIDDLDDFGSLDAIPELEDSPEDGPDSEEFIVIDNFDDVEDDPDIIDTVEPIEELEEIEELDDIEELDEPGQPEPVDSSGDDFPDEIEFMDAPEEDPVELADPLESPGTADDASVVILDADDDDTSDRTILLLPDDDDADDAILLEDDAEAALEEMMDYGNSWMDDETGENDELLITLPTFPIFSELEPAAFVGAVQQIRRVRFFEDEAILKEGDNGDSFFLISVGSVKVVKKGKDGKQIQLAVLKEGDFFGEFAFLMGTPRSATVLAGDHCEILEFTREALDTLIQEHPPLRKVLEDFYRRRTISGALKISPLIRAIPADKREQFVKYLEPVTVDDGEIIVKKGDTLDGLYIVLQGNVAVAGAPGIKKLVQGDFFGEYSLLTGKPNPYAVKAVGNVNLYKLSRKIFGKLVKAFPDTGKVLKSAAKKRSGS